MTDNIGQIDVRFTIGRVRDNPMEIRKIGVRAGAAEYMLICDEVYMEPGQDDRSDMYFLKNIRIISGMSNEPVTQVYDSAGALLQAAISNKLPDRYDILMDLVDAGTNLPCPNAKITYAEITFAETGHIIGTDLSDRPILTEPISPMVQPENYLKASVSYHLKQLLKEAEQAYAGLADAFGWDKNCFIAENLFTRGVWLDLNHSKTGEPTPEQIVYPDH